MSKLFDFVDKATAEGHGVLIHCLAGAHRAGTAGVAYIMHAAQVDLPTALARARPTSRTSFDNGGGVGVVVVLVACVVCVCVVWWR